jgi:hypothetical protein
MLGVMLVARSSALEIIQHPDGRTIARRYAVHATIIKADVIEHAEMTDEPVEEFVLPLTRAAATEWVYRYFEDLSIERIIELVRRLTRPTGPLL